MSTYRPNYRDHSRPYHDLPPPPPPSNLLAPLPRGPPPYDSYQPNHQHALYDSWRPVNGIDQRSEFTFRNDASAPQYPREQDYLRPTRSAQYARQENNRPNQRSNNRDGVNLNRARRGQYYHNRRANRPAPSDRPLLRHLDKDDSSSEKMLGLINGQSGVSKFMPADDVSDSDEEQMEQSESEGARSNAGDADQGEITEGSLEPRAKRRALATSFRNAQDGASEPRWSNPDPYTALPPVDENQRKRKDVVKLIRKARKESEAAAAERNQVAANDDFISFAMDEDAPDLPDESPSSPSEDWREEYGAGVPGAPTGPRQLSRLEDFPGGDTPGTYEKTISADSLGPPPGLPLSPSPPPPPSLPILPEKIVLDTSASSGCSSTNSDTSVLDVGGDDALGSRKRTYDDNVKSARDRKGKRGKALGPILKDWVPADGVDPIPWVRRLDKLTANSGFR